MPLSARPIKRKKAALIAASVQETPIKAPEKPLRIPSTIRVLLKEFPLDQPCSFDISAPDNVVVADAANPIVQVAYPFHNMHLYLENNNLFLKDPHQNVKRIKKDTITISSNPHNLSLNNVPYQGLITLKIDREAKTLQLINTVDLEDYVYGVLRWESFQSWPHKMQMVQAIASRTFAVYHILNARAMKQPYDLKNSNFHQTYNGTHEFEHLRQAVDETAGTVLMHNNKVVLAMFDICCGGIVTAHMKSPNFSEAPYLARKKACNYCNTYKLYSWQQEFTLDDLLKKFLTHKTMGDQVGKIGKLKDLHICEKDKAGIIHKIKLVGSKKNLVLSARQLSDCLKPQIKSLSFGVKKNDSGALVIKGSGFGHQIGLCQRGARELVKQEWSHDRILGFYYPQTQLHIAHKEC